MKTQPDDADKRPEGKSSAFGIGTVIRGLRRYPLLALLFLLVAAAAGAGIWFFLPLPKMTAFVIFTISSQPDVVIGPVGGGDSTYFRHQVALVKSRAVLTRAVRDGEIAQLELLKREPDTSARVGWLESKIGIDVRQQPDFMRLTLEGDQEEEIKAIIKAVSDAFVKESLERDKRSVIDRNKKLESVQTKYRNELRSKQLTLKDLADQLHTTDPAIASLKEKYVLEHLGMVQRELFQTESEMRRAAVESDILKKRTNELDKITVPEETVTEAVQTENEFKKLIGEQTELKRLIDETKNSLQPGAHPAALIEKEKLLEEKNKEVDAFRKKISPQVAARLKDLVAGESKRALANLNQKKTVLGDDHDAIKKVIDGLTEQLSNIGKCQVALESIRQEIGKSEATSARIQDQIDINNLELDANPRVQVFEDPVVVQGIEGNRRLKYSLLVFGGFLLFGVGLIAFLEARNRRIIKTQDAADDLGLNLIGTVPAMPYRSKTLTAKDEGLAKVWQSMLTESVDVARTVLVHSLGPKKSGHSILIASAMPGEGKTLLACHLASSFARAGFRTLLVDGDMRRPTVHRVLGAAQTPGLCELLRGETAPQEAIRPSPVPGLSLLPAGLWDTRVAPTLSTDRWETLRGQLEGSFDYVLIDSSPLLLVTDTLLLGRNSEGVVLSVLRDVSHVHDLELARDRLKFLGIKVLGVVVNGFNGPGYSHAYPYYRPEMHANVEAATVPQSTTAG